MLFRCSRRIPHGVRGLKYGCIIVVEIKKRSHPSRGAWIEIRAPVVATLTGMSHPSRGAWIEIKVAIVTASGHTVASLTGCVD